MNNLYLFILMGILFIWYYIKWCIAMSDPRSSKYLAAMYLHYIEEQKYKRGE
jgi:hypothetical protein